MKAKKFTMGAFWMVLAVCCALTAPAFGQTKGQNPPPPPSDVKVQSLQVTGPVVLVKVKNTANIQRLTSVKVTAMVNGQSQTSIVPVLVGAKQTANAVAGFLNPVDSVIVVGIQEGSSPF